MHILTNVSPSSIFTDTPGTLIVFLLFVPIIFALLYLHASNAIAIRHKNHFSLLNGFFILIFSSTPILLCIAMRSSTNAFESQRWLFFGNYYIIFFTLVIFIHGKMKFLKLYLLLILIVVWLPSLWGNTLLISIIRLTSITKKTYWYEVRLVNSLFFILFGGFFIFLAKARELVEKVLAIRKGKNPLRFFFLSLVGLLLLSLAFQGGFYNANPLTKQLFVHGALWLLYLFIIIFGAILIVLLLQSFFPVKNEELMEQNLFFERTNRIYNFNSVNYKITCRSQDSANVQKKNINYGLCLLVSNKDIESILYCKDVITKLTSCLRNEFAIVWPYEYEKEQLLFFVAYSVTDIHQKIYKLYEHKTIRYQTINHIFRKINQNKSISLSCKIISHGLHNDNLSASTKMLVANHYNYCFEQVTKYIRIYNPQFNYQERKNYVLLERFMAEDKKNLAFDIHYVVVEDDNSQKIGYYLDVERFYEFYDVALYENIFKRYLIFKALTGIINSCEQNKIFFIAITTRLFHDSPKWRSGLRHALVELAKNKNKLCIIFQQGEYEQEFRVIKKIFLFKHHFPNLEICISDCTFSEWIITSINELSIKYVIPTVAYTTNNSSQQSPKIAKLWKKIGVIANKYRFYVITTDYRNSLKKSKRWRVLNYDATDGRKLAFGNHLAITNVKKSQIAKQQVK